MSVKQAFEFIHRVRSEEALADRLERISGLDELAALAAQNGCRFTVEELQSAFAKDAAMRRWYYSRRTGGDNP